MRLDWVVGKTVCATVARAELLSYRNHYYFNFFKKEQNSNDYSSSVAQQG
jgi:hypothetical protein